MARRRPQLLALVIGLAIVAGVAVTRPAPRPRLVVLLAVDGLSWDRLAASRPWFTAGLKRLLDEGAVATECRYGHLNTLTGPGHASLATGAPPRVHGIPANQWYVPAADRRTMVTEYCADGPQRLRVPTLGDALVAAEPSARVVSLSIKDRAAILMAGRDERHTMAWFDEAHGTFVARGPAAAIVAQFNTAKAGPNLASRYGTVVSRLPVPSPAPAPVADGRLAPFQDAVVGHGFPLDLSKTGLTFAASLTYTTLGDRLLVDLALDLVDDEGVGLGRDDVPDLLAISFSANDYVSHDYGPESVEALEVLRGLDHEVGRLLDALVHRFSKDAIAVVVSADHGMLPLPGKAGRVDEARLVRALNDRVRDELHVDRAIYRLDGCSLWLDRTKTLDTERVLAVIRKELTKRWRRAIERTVSEGDRSFAPAWNATVPGRSGDLFLIPRPGTLLGASSGRGTTHGTPWDYDAHVPLIFWGGGIAPQSLSRRVTPYDLAPTVAAWVGVALPDATGTRLDVRVGPATDQMRLPSSN